MTDAGEQAQAPVMGKLAVRKQRTRAAILDAAERLFDDPGYEATTMQDIATLAEIGLGTLYGYFVSKEELLRTILAGRRDAAVARGAEELRRVQGALDRACLLLRQVWEYLDANRRVSLALTAIDASRPPTQRPPEQYDLFGALVHHLRRGQEQGEIAAVHLEASARALLSTYTWAALRIGIWRDAGEPAAVLEDLERLTRSLLTPVAGRA
ncbi:MAG TPA: helix-turn-helix domain-containing protein [Dehalococcoidia bacterium]|nr:helix-turn-helix domain-containing protein [Dehalococcoidia bacterium]